jgi:hypothetical protein
MKRRFEQRIEFPDWAPEDLLRLVLKSSESEQVACPEALHPFLLDGFTELANLEHFGNAVRDQILLASSLELWTCAPSNRNTTAPSRSPFPLLHDCHNREMRSQSLPKW